MLFNQLQNETNLTNSEKEIARYFLIPTLYIKNGGCYEHIFNWSKKVFWWRIYI